MTKQEVVVLAAIQALPECKRATPNPDTAAESAVAAGVALADKLAEYLPAKAKAPQKR